MVLLNRLDIVGDGILHIHKRLTARCVVVTTTVEVATSKGVYIYTAVAAERNADKATLLLGEHCRHFNLLYREWIVYKTLAVALLEPELTHLILGQREVGNSTLEQSLHLAIDNIAKQTRTTLGTSTC